jgi:methylmalonyl-CoA/ethylmalonyl-CoA epimerase
MFPPGLVLGIDHVGIAVADLDEAVAFYRSAFGFQVVHEETNPEQGVREAMVAVGAGDTMLQLLAPLTPESAIGRFLAKSGPGIQQLAYRVSDIEAAMSSARDSGLRLLYDDPHTGTGGRRINFIHPRDAGGVLVELIELA